MAVASCAVGKIHFTPHCTIRKKRIKRKLATTPFVSINIWPQGAKRFENVPESAPVLQLLLVGQQYCFQDGIIVNNKREGNEERKEERLRNTEISSANGILHSSGPHCSTHENHFFFVAKRTFVASSRSSVEVREKHSQTKT